MNRKSMKSLALAILLLVTIAGFSQSQAQTQTIDPEAEIVLRKMSDHLHSKPASAIKLVDTIDDVFADGRKLQFSHVREITILRPDKFRLEVKGDVTNRIIWKDGKSLTIYDRDHGVYTSIEDNGTIAETVSMLQEDYGMSLPAADFLSEDIYTTLTNGCSLIEYLGFGYVNEEECHHLAFVQDHVDYQLWLSNSENPEPRKLLITYKQLPGEPQYTLQLLQAKDPKDIKASEFTPDIPESAEKIDLKPLESAK